MHSQTFMHYVDAHQKRKKANAVDVQCEEWGPHGTRFFVLAMVALVARMIVPISPC
jgi:hypothetical protein